jgi:hypothetical protein
MFTLAINCGQSKMNNNTKGLVYGGMGLAGQDEEGLEEPGPVEKERVEDEEQGEVVEIPGSVAPLSRCRLFQATINLSAVSGNRVAWHAIVYADESLEVASTALLSDAMFDGERLQHTHLRPALVDKPRNFDRLYKKQYGNISIFARPWVIHQWLAVLIAVHPYYQSITAPQYPDLCHVTNEANRCSCRS